jgi:hypothetical protein
VSAIGACESLRNLFNWSLCVMALSSMGWCQDSVAGDGNAVTIRCLVGAGAALLVVGTRLLAELAGTVRFLWVV